MAGKPKKKSFIIKVGIVLAVILTPLFLWLTVSMYQSSTREYLQYFNEGEPITAEVITKQLKKSRSTHCLVFYKYSVANTFFRGDDMVPGGCGKINATIKIFYLPTRPEESKIGFAFGLYLLPICFFIMFISYRLAFLPRVHWKKKTRNKRQSFIFLIQVIIVGTYCPLLIFKYSYPLFLSDDFIAEVIMIGALLLTLYCLFYSYRIYRLYTQGVCVEGIIKKIVNENHKDTIKRYKIFYEFSHGGKRVNGNDYYYKKDREFEVNDKINLLYYPGKVSFNCIDY